jgi:hypothetical protein
MLVLLLFVTGPKTVAIDLNKRPSITFIDVAFEMVKG